MGRTSGLCSPGLPSRGHSRQQASSRTPDPFFLQICEAEPQPQTHYPESAWATAPPPFAKVLGPEAAARVPRQARRPTPMPRTLRRVLESHTPDGGRRMSLRRTPLWVFPRPLGTHPKPTFAPVDGGPTPTPRAASRGPAPSPQPSAPTAQVAAPHAPRRCGPQRSRPPETLPTPSAPSLPPPPSLPASPSAPLPSPPAQSQSRSPLGQFRWSPRPAVTSRPAARAGRSGSPTGVGSRGTSVRPWRGRRRRAAGRRTRPFETLARGAGGSVLRGTGLLGRAPRKASRELLSRRSLMTASTSGARLLAGGRAGGACRGLQHSSLGAPPTESSRSGIPVLPFPFFPQLTKYGLVIDISTE